MFKKLSIEGLKQARESLKNALKRRPDAALMEISKKSILEDAKKTSKKNKKERAAKPRDNEKEDLF